MSGVLTDAVGRQDVLIRRGAVTEWVILWENSIDGGTTFDVVPLYGEGYTARLRLLSPNGDVWLEKSANVTHEHYVLMSIAPADLSDPSWASRSGGVWICDLFSSESGAEACRHGEGYFYLEA